MAIKVAIDLICSKSEAIIFSTEQYGSKKKLQIQKLFDLHQYCSIEIIILEMQPKKGRRRGEFVGHSTAVDHRWYGNEGRVAI